jgi:hypothetical protein
MSRRITFFVLAASAALIASPASADRECFENSCGLPAAAEALPQANPSPELEPRAEDAQPELARPDVALKPVKTLPPVVQAVPAKPVQTKEPRQIQPLAPGALVEARQERAGETAPIEVMRVAPRYARTERPAAYGVSHSVTGGAGVIEMPGAVYAPSPAGPFYPYAQPDAAWRSCQVEGQQRGVVYCGPTSYHPYGEYGYRPNGTYGSYRRPPVYATAPDAKIITIEAND